MAEINSTQKIKTIAFYLPQFHCIPENDKAHGSGFTEWTNTAKAVPLFENHYQPRTPLDENYYNLLDPEVLRQQAKIAKENGVFGFCYYHYWFKNGKKLLEKPVEAMLDDKEVDIPFCLCWANENWSKRWDGGNNEIIVEQDYGGEDEWRAHIDYLERFFRDERYITIDGKPLFIVYRPELMPNLKKWVSYMRNAMIERGFPGIVMAVQFPYYGLYCNRFDLFDYYILFEPMYTRELSNIKRSRIKYAIRKSANKIGLGSWYEALNSSRKRAKEKVVARSLEIRSYDEDWMQIISRHVSKNGKQIPGAFVDWDNTPRNKCGIAYVGATPEKFGAYFSSLIKKTKNDYNQNIIFINAWNEWAEGAYLEPDQRYGYAYLNALHRSLLDNDLD